MEKIYRLHYRAQLNADYTETELAQAVAKCQDNIRELQKSNRVLTAALYRHERMIFLYYEALGEPLPVVEPIALAGEATIEDAKDSGTKETQDVLLESGEDIQITAVHPTEFLAPLESFLMLWPGQTQDRLWVHMYYIYCHSYPQSVDGWKRATIPEHRRGRIAFLRDDKLFGYVYYHKAIVDEGLLTGDKYQSIALHENILFSYFEEPKTFVNVKNSQSESKVIHDWIAVDPESHFIHMPQGEGENFMLLPALFALGVEDLEH